MYRKTKIAILFALIFTVPIALTMAGPSNKSGSADPAAGIKASLDKAPKAVFPDLKFEFSPIFEGETIKHDFVVQNKGEAPLVIKRIRPD